jgi:hypothetical protein
LPDTFKQLSKDRTLPRRILDLVNDLSSVLYEEVFQWTRGQDLHNLIGTVLTANQLNYSDRTARILRTNLIERVKSTMDAWCAYANVPLIDPRESYLLVGFFVIRHRSFPTHEDRSSI